MRIGDQPQLPKTSTAPKVQSTKPADGPAIAGDSFTSSDQNVNVVSFNVAGGNSHFKREAALVDTPLFQKLIKGDADAPVVACQETTPALAKKLIEESKNGNFQVIYPGQSWMPKWVPVSTLMQGNMLLVPKRYQVQKSEAHTFSGRAGKFFEALKGFIFHHAPAKDMLMALQDRGYVKATLKDTKTGKTFNVVGTHIAYDDKIRRMEAPQLRDVMKQAESEAPTVLMGDFNTPTLAHNPHPNQGVTDFWKEVGQVPMQDLGPDGKESVSFWGNGSDIDSVLGTKGVEKVSGEMLTGDKMTLPGHPDAKYVSDHYAESDTIRIE